MLLFGIDPLASIGRVDYDSFSQQTQMEMLIAGILNRERLFGCTDWPESLSGWRGIDLNENDEVTKILWNRKYLEGTIAWDWLPKMIKVVKLGRNRISGSIPLEIFPNGILDFLMASNHLSGTISLTALPESLQTLNLSTNLLSGSINLTCLPVNMRMLRIAQNRLSGTLDLTKLPSTLIELVLSRNNFSGETDFGQLSDSLTDFHFSENTKLSGRFVPNRKINFSAFSTKVELDYSLYLQQ